MTKIYIDIETCPSQDPAVKAAIRSEIKPPATHKKAETIAAWMAENADSEAEEQWRKTSFDGALGHICVIGLAIDDNLPASLYSQNWHADEADILRQFFETVDRAVSESPNVQPVFIGHNVIDFDLRFIFQRAVVLGVKPSPHIPFNARPYGDRSVFDTMTMWAGVRNRVTLDKLARVLGAGGKGDMDGSMVWDAVNAGEIDAVADYCRADIEMTRAVHRRMTFSMPVESAWLEKTDGIPF